LKGKASACYATLMKLERVSRFDDVFCGKRDRRGWVILTAGKNKFDCRDGGVLPNLPAFMRRVRG